ncbi:hypothetical protein HGRIS_010083 [Hohenbuehelia grisea]|uniref:VWFA domain-containing protein n=1 Tax=Hohenbuehelia grisea TaxID=104357 RepID=A0ABR3J383_9AGAR
MGATSSRNSRSRLKHTTGTKYHFDPSLDASMPPHAVASDGNPGRDGDGGLDPPPYSPRATSSHQPQRSNVENPLELLRKYDTVILLDDSGSMNGTKWEEACKALSGLADIAGQYDTDGIELHFLNNEYAGASNLRNGFQVNELFAQVRPSGMTPIGDRLECLMREYLRKAEKAEKEGKLEFIKPINYLVITDGRPSDDPESVIMAVAQRLDDGHFPLTQLGIQFVQIGQDSTARKYLTELDDDLTRKHKVRDIVDTTPCTVTNGKISSEVLMKILLGAINRRIDREGIESS